MKRIVASLLLVLFLGMLAGCNTGDEPTRPDEIIYRGQTISLGMTEDEVVRAIGMGEQGSYGLLVYPDLQIWFIDNVACEFYATTDKVVTFGGYAVGDSIVDATAKYKLGLDRGTYYMAFFSDNKEHVPLDYEEVLEMNNFICIEYSADFYYNDESDNEQITSIQISDLVSVYS